MIETPLNIDYEIRRFRQRLTAQGRSESSRHYLPEHVGDFLRFCERSGYPDPLTQVSVDAFFTYLTTRPNKRTGRPLSKAYINKYRQAVLRYIEYKRETRLGGSGVDVPVKKVDPIPKHILTKREIKQLFEATDRSLTGITDRVMLALLYGCGLRLSELVNLETTDIDLVRSVILLRKTKTKFDREVPMSPSVKKNIQDYLFSAREARLTQISHEPKFLISNAGTGISKQFVPYRLRVLKSRTTITKPVTAHALRHAIATHLFADRAFTLEQVQAFLGHRSLDATMIYTHLVNQLKNGSNN